MNAFRAYLVVLSVWTIVSFLARSAGRMAPRAVFAPLLFLITRRAVLAAWALATLAIFATLLPGSLARGRDQLSDLLVIAWLSAFCGLGAAAMVVGPLFFAARLFAPKPAFALEPGEELVRTVAANHFLQGEARGGELLLTTRRLGFRPHRFNVQCSTWSASLADVRGFRVEGLRFVVAELGDPPREEWIVVADPAGLTRQVLGLAGRSPDASA